MVKSLDRLGLGTNDADTVHKLQLMSVISAFLHSIPHRILSSGLERINISNKLRDISGRIENTGDMGMNGGKVVSEPVDEIQTTTTNCQVSNKAQTG